MNKTISAQGHCLCGAVQIHASNIAPGVGACHCGTCRRWGGGPFMEVNCGDAISFDGEDHIKVYNSSEWAERGFCSACGTHLFYRLKHNGEHMVPVGLFALDEELTFDHQVFIDERPCYYQFANDTEKMTGAEVFEKYSG